jgi:hypothetical protein
MQRPTAAVPLICLALLSVCLWLTGGCAKAPTFQLTQGTTAQGTTTTCSLHPIRFACPVGKRTETGSQRHVFGGRPQCE